MSLGRRDLERALKRAAVDALCARGGMGSEDFFNLQARTEGLRAALYGQHWHTCAYHKDHPCFLAWQAGWTEGDWFVQEIKSRR